MLNCLFVGLGGFIGAVCRYLVGLIPTGEAGGFPVKTLVINIIGAFAIGVLAALAARNVAIDSRLMLFLKVGICGGFTTFSTFSLETVTLFQSGKGALGALYIVLSVCLCVGAVLAAEALVK